MKEDLIKFLEKDCAQIQQKMENALESGDVGTYRNLMKTLAEANDLIKSMDAKINESIDKCLNKILFDLENDSSLKKSNFNLELRISSHENSNISTINENFKDLDFIDLVENIDFPNEDFLNAQKTFSDWIAYNQSHLPGFIIVKYKEPVLANIDGLTLIIGSLETIECYDGLDRFLEVLNDFLDNQEAFLNNF